MTMNEKKPVQKTLHSLFMLPRYVREFPTLSKYFKGMFTIWPIVFQQGYTQCIYAECEKSVKNFECYKSTEQIIKLDWFMWNTYVH